MEGQLVDIEYENGLVEIAKIIEDTPDHFIVTHLVRVFGDTRFRFSRMSYPVPKESVSGFYDTKDLEETGLYKKIDETFYEPVNDSDSDDDYSSDDSSDSESEVSLDSE
jgi:hypothetical protein